MRIALTSSGDLEIDNTGKKVGRGAYLCRSNECCEAGLKEKRLGHALRGDVSKADLKRVLSEARKLLKGAE